MFDQMNAQLDRLKASRGSVTGGDSGAGEHKLFQFYNRIMTEATNSERCSIFIHDPKRDSVWLKAGTGMVERDIEVPVQDSVAGEAILTGKTIVVAHMDDHKSAHKTVQEATGFITRNLLCVPIKSPILGQITGVFQILNKNDNGEFTGQDIALAEEIAEHLQIEADRIFVDQEAFDLIERISSAPGKVATFVLASVVLMFLMSIVVLAGTGIMALLLG
ncbi:MAG: GAF domain-containing protein [Rhodospirillaceae bacterium]|jgi:GAF domain-containing protein|nr:GAF domain-containing protein [Rhodospirillaceae bacterium]MBT4673891.1 GAF domain-containing protein [Rhodospirillaceae bacterium]MBT4719351.1 GAF domain-containing protein [Rhodospirillaceae bacterium]MBT4751921.1 GAF domain-containing protein [Rhodospirillaceae bacterium]MBT5179719.1 GAF domain-containing protein [Rhodospirillaceae bacterium]